MEIQWTQFLLVVGTALLSAVVVVGLFATGIRLFATPRDAQPAPGGPRDEEFDDVPRGSRPTGATVGGVAAFALAGAVAAFGVLLIVLR